MSWEGWLGWLRFLPIGAANGTDWGILFLLAGLAAAFYGVVVGLTQDNPKTVLAYSSISQMGLMTVIVGSGILLPDRWPQALTAVSIYAIHHGLAKGSLFLGVGVARSGWHGTRNTWWFRAGLLLPALALSGLPLTSGAIAKTALKGIVSPLAEPWYGLCHWLLPLAAVGTTMLVFHFLGLVWQPAQKPGAQAVRLCRAWMVNVFGVAVVLWLWPEAWIPARETLKPGMIRQGSGRLQSVSLSSWDGNGLSENRALVFISLPAICWSRLNDISGPGGPFVIHR